MSESPPYSLDSLRKVLHTSRHHYPSASACDEVQGIWDSSKYALLTLLGIGGIFSDKARTPPPR